MIITGRRQAWTRNSPGTWLSLPSGATCSIQGWFWGKNDFAGTAFCVINEIVLDSKWHKKHSTPLPRPTRGSIAHYGHG